jgi:hypothetical protein
MAVVVFLLGRPGSGKSQIARCIKGDESPAASDMEEKYLPENWETVHITDYKYLLRMFQEEEKQRLDPEKRYFESSEHGGFTVTNFGFSRAVLDKALKQVNVEILQETKDEQKQKLILVEFARSDYRNIKNVFDTKILESASVLYLQAELEVCVGRVHQRVLHYPRWEDDSFVPNDIMEGYYGEEDFVGLRRVFRKEKVEVINNNGDWNDTWVEVKGFIEKICLENK